MLMFNVTIVYTKFGQIVSIHYPDILGTQNFDFFRGSNSVTILQKLQGNNLRLDLVNVAVHTFPTSLDI